ncbi:MAG: hypothetical protein KAH22_09680 [Thiotrichaceae bacterium]|nr:hypothetical protein [Thiotrichaceae bacterium]
MSVGKPKFFYERNKLLNKYCFYKLIISAILFILSLFFIGYSVFLYFESNAANALHINKIKADFNKAIDEEKEILKQYNEERSALRLSLQKKESLLQKVTSKEIKGNIKYIKSTIDKLDVNIDKLDVNIEKSKAVLKEINNKSMLEEKIIKHIDGSPSRVFWIFFSVAIMPFSIALLLLVTVIMLFISYNRYQKEIQLNLINIDQYHRFELADSLCITFERSEKYLSPKINSTDILKVLSKMNDANKLMKRVYNKKLRLDKKESNLAHNASNEEKMKILDEREALEREEIDAGLAQTTVIEDFSKLKVPQRKSTETRAGLIRKIYEFENTKSV